MKRRHAESMLIRSKNVRRKLLEDDRMGPFLERLSVDHDYYRVFMEARSTGV